MRRVMRRGWKVIAAGTGLLMLGTAIGTLGAQAQTNPRVAFLCARRVPARPLRGRLCCF